MSNRLADETSPYLRQHAENPVDWYPWGEAAFALARERYVPVFLSVGYSSCHWCHVMAHESFEDPGTADEMNRLFVNVKVDREERPDVDAIYMQSVQALTGRGGWPMSVWCTPDGRPFYAGTYFPSDDRHGMPSFRRVLAAVAEAWRDKRDDVLEQSEQLTAALAEDPLGHASGELSGEILTNAYAAVRAQFEPRYGGFGRAPKFPLAMTIDFCCRAYLRNHADETRNIISTTLDGMAAGGIHDQLGGGFARYSTDDFWLVPHFEKMLYDNALLTRAYLHGYLTTGEARYRAVVEDTVGYVLRDLRHENGGFFSAEDADSEGIEGRFYCWSIDEIRDVCGPDADAAIAWFGVTEQGNFVDPHTGFRGNILRVVGSVDDDAPPAVQRAKHALFERRARRVRPGLDDKILLAWNALMLSSLAEAAAALDRDDWMDAARVNAGFLLGELRRPDGRFLRSWRAPYLAYAEDYAALVEALVTMAELDDIAWLAEARVVADELLRLFHDPDGGFYTTGHDAERLVVRQKDFFDDATPSANSLAANGLLRLAALTGEDRYEEPAVAVLTMLARAMSSHPTAFAHMLAACERHLTPPLEVAIVGGRADQRTTSLLREVTHRLLPASVLVTAEPGRVDGIPLLADRELRDGAPTAYVCEHYACRQPVTDPGELGAQLDAVLAQRATT